MGASQKRGANPGCEEGYRMNQVHPRGEGVFTGKTGHTKIGICQKTSILWMSSREFRRVQSPTSQVSFVND